MVRQRSIGDRVPQRLVDAALGHGGHVDGEKLGAALSRVEASGRSQTVSVRGRPRGQKVHLRVTGARRRDGHEGYEVTGAALQVAQLGSVLNVDLVRWDKARPTGGAHCGPEEDDLHVYSQDEPARKPNKTSANVTCIPATSVIDGITAMLDAANITVSQIPATLPYADGGDT